MSVVVKLLPCVKIGMTRWYRKGKHVVRDFTSNWIGQRPLNSCGDTD